MRLTDFLQLINDLNSETTFYFKIDKKIYPLSKIVLTSEACLLNTHKQALTKANLVQLLGKTHQRQIPIIYKHNDQKFPFYGLQISLNNHTATLM